MRSEKCSLIGKPNHCTPFQARHCRQQDTVALGHVGIGTVPHGGIWLWLQCQCSTQTPCHQFLPLLCSAPLLYALISNAPQCRQPSGHWEAHPRYWNQFLSPRWSHSCPGCHVSKPKRRQITFMSLQTLCLAWKKYRLSCQPVPNTKPPQALYLFPWFF